MEAECSKRVEVIGKDDKRQLTAVLAGALDGDFLPSQLIYRGTTPCCLPKYEFPKKWHITYSANHWSNKETMTEYLGNVLVSFVAEKRESLNLSEDYPALVVFDNFKAQCISAFLTQLDHNNINVVLVPPNCLQPFDVSVNKAVKNQLCAEFQHWHARQVCQQQREGQRKPINLKMSAVKPLSASWIVSACSYVKNNPEIIINGFKGSGIASCI